MKRVLSIGLLLLFTLLFAGCLGASALDQYGYVVIAGVDEGEQRRYAVTFMMQQDQSGDSSNQAGSPGATTVTAEGDTIFEAMRLVDSCMPYELNLSRMSLIIFSDAVVRKGDMQHFLDFSWNTLKLRQSVKLAVALDSAKDFIKGIETGGMLNLTKLQYGFMQNYTGEGLTTAINYALLMQGIDSMCFDPVLTLCKLDKSATQAEGTQPDAKYTTSGLKRTGGMQSYTSGVAVFDGWNMTGVLNEQDTVLLLMVEGEFENGHMVFTNGEDYMVLLLKKGGAPQVKFDRENNRAEVHIPLKCEIQQNSLGDAEERWEGGVREEASRYIESELARVFEQCQKLRSDAMGFGKYAAMKCASVNEWEEYNWKEHYSSLETVFSVELKLVDRSITGYME